MCTMTPKGIMIGKRRLKSTTSQVYCAVYLAVEMGVKWDVISAISVLQGV